MRLNKTTLSLFFLFALAFSLRFYRVGQPVFKEEENSTTKAAAYVYYCQKDSVNCFNQHKTFKKKLLALMTGNETVPNLFAEVYLWDFIKDAPDNIHFSRAWPHLYAQAAAYRWLGINELSSRLVSVVAGSLVVIVGYWFSRILGSSVQVSLLYSGLLAISFPLIDFSRHARMYSLYMVVFLFLVGLIYLSKWLSAGLMFLLAYWLQLLTSILPIAVMIWSILEKRRWLTFSLLIGLVVVVGSGYYWKIDFFHDYFLGPAWPPHWEYLKFLFSYPLPWWLGLVLFFAGKSSRYLKVIILTYLSVLIFGTSFPPGGAYVLALLPLAIWGQFAWIKSKLVWGIILLIATVRLVASSGYLYFNRDDRAQISKAYPVLANKFQSGDKIYAVQLRDYYLQDLPPETEVIDLQENPQPEFFGSGFVVWEREKAVHFLLETLAHIEANFDHLAGEGLDEWEVEIYSFGK